MGDKPFNKATLSHMDVSMRAMMERSYDLCLYSCMERREETMQCKQNCFLSIQVPFRHANHIARDNEEANYRKCLGKRPSFPVLNPEDYTACSNDLFKERIEIMSNYVADEASKIFQHTRP